MSGIAQMRQLVRDDVIDLYHEYAGAFFLAGIRLRRSRRGYERVSAVGGISIYIWRHARLGGGGAETGGVCL